MQRHFDRDIEAIKDLLLRMGAMVEDTISQSIRALMERNTELAEQVIAGDDAIDRMEIEIDQKTIELIAKMQPAATDLRFVAAIMKITPELERIADLAQDVCERVMELNREPQLKPYVDLPRMAETAQAMVRDALDAFVQADPERAREVVDRDRAVDAYYGQVFRELLTYMMEDPRNISFCTHLLFCAKNIERIGDHTTNIAETVHYLVTGENLAGERPKDDRSSFESVEAET